MTVIAIVSETTNPEAVLFEAADRAEERNQEVHVVYLVGMNWIGRLELMIADRLNIWDGRDTIRELAKRQATNVADPVLEEFTPVGLTGDPVPEIVEYADRVDAECIVISGGSKLVTGVLTLFRDPIEELVDHGFEVIPVY